MIHDTYVRIYNRKQYVFYYQNKKDCLYSLKDVHIIIIKSNIHVILQNNDYVVIDPKLLPCINTDSFLENIFYL